jgi:hypothetical protein
MSRKLGALGALVLAMGILVCSMGVKTALTVGHARTTMTAANGPEPVPPPPPKKNSGS